MFISYGREPAVNQFVQRLKKDLEEGGLTVWLDTKDIPAESDWHGAIGSGLERCKAIIPVLTSKYISSRYCVNEVCVCVCVRATTKLQTSDHAHTPPTDVSAEPPLIGPSSIKPFKVIPDVPNPEGIATTDEGNLIVTIMEHKVVCPCNYWLISYSMYASYFHNHAVCPGNY